MTRLPIQLRDWRWRAGRTKMRRVTAILCLLAAASAAPFTQTKEPPRNKELEGLHAHFEKAVRDRHDQALQLDHHGRAMGGAEKEKPGPRFRKCSGTIWASGLAAPRDVTHTEQREAYTIENLVIKPRPKVFLTANLYCPNRPEAISRGALSVRAREQEFVRAAWRLVCSARNRRPGDGQHRDGRGRIHPSWRVLQRLVSLVQPGLFPSLSNC